jgi:RNA polymerase sigma-70 factor (ECF subfamily)
MSTDEEFYDSVIQPIEEPMMACIWKITQNRENAQDAMQESLVAIWRKRGRIAAHPNPKALVLRICRDKAIDGLRKAIRRSRWELPTSLPDETWPAPAHSPTPATDLHREEFMAHIRNLIATLPRKQAQAVLMHLVEDQPYADIAATLGCSEATVRSHVRRGRDHLRNKLQDLRGGPIQ